MSATPSAAAAVDSVTARYAEALFRLAMRGSCLSIVDKDVRRIADEVSSEKVCAFLFDARIEESERRAKLAPVLADMHELTRNFVNLLFDKRREAVLRSLGAAWHRRSLAERGEVEGVVESARPLGDDELGRLSASLRQKLSKDVHLTNRIVPDLLGGVRVVVAGRLVDYSVRGRIDGLRRRLLEAPLSAART